MNTLGDNAMHRAVTDAQKTSAFACSLFLYEAYQKNKLELVDSQKMSQFFFFRAEVVGGGWLGRDLDRDPLDDL